MSGKVSETLGAARFGSAIAVLVAYNRSALLAEALRAVSLQTVLPYGVIVVNNASTDDTAGVADLGLRELQEKGVKTRLINLTENTGGAGGFAVGIAAAQVLGGAQWIWVMDDDTVAHPDALEKALNAHRKYKETGHDNLALMGSKVVWSDGTLHPMNRVRPKTGASSTEKRRTAHAGGYPSRSNSFVSAFLRAEVVGIVGLPIADYFIWVDDFEFSQRLTRLGYGVLVEDSVATHKTAEKYASDRNPGSRFFNEVRNKVWLLRFSTGLKISEKAYFIVRTLRRWGLTLLQAADKKTVWEMIKRGAAEGFGQKPRPNVAVLADCGVPGDVLRVIIELDDKA